MIDFSIWKGHRVWNRFTDSTRDTTHIHGPPLVLSQFRSLTWVRTATTMPRTYEPPAATSKRDREPAAGANSRKAAKKQHYKKQGSSKASEGMESAESGACVSTHTTHHHPY